MGISRKERKQLQREERAGSSSLGENSSSIAPAEPKKSKVWLYAGIGVGIVLLIAAGVAGSYFFTPGPYDDFAKCLSEKGAQMYGAMGWCQYTQGQKAMFGKSFTKINYHEFGEFPKDMGEIKVTPTWIINGKAYPNTQSFDDLAQATGCPLP